MSLQYSYLFSYSQQILRIYFSNGYNNIRILRWGTLVGSFQGKQQPNRI
jgi:hypothetical protein